MAPLNRKLNRDEYEEIDEKLYDLGSDIRINYEGTIAYTKTDKDYYGLHFLREISRENPTNVSSLFQQLKDFDLGVDLNRAYPYRCLWYNGADSYMDMIILEEFLENTN